MQTLHVPAASSLVEHWFEYEPEPVELAIFVIFNGSNVGITILQHVLAVHGTVHTVFANWVQAVFTPRVHVASAAHPAHGPLHEKESENDVPATHVFVFLYTLLPSLVSP